MNDRRNDFEIAPNFRAYELECHGEDCCGHAVVVVPKLARALQALRWRLGVALSPSCGYRCPKHNKEVGGSQTSDHLTGEAVDIPTPRGIEPKELAALCLRCGFSRAGYYPTRNFVHASVRKRPDLPRLWNGED